MKKVPFLFTLTAISVIALTGCAKNSAQTTASKTTLSPGIPLPSPEDTKVSPVKMLEFKSKDGKILTLSEKQFTELTVKNNEPYQVVDEDIYTATYDEAPEVVRYDRYTLVSSKPNGGQKYLLEQVISVDIPTGKGKNTLYPQSVRQGLEAALKHSGFSLCYFPNDVVSGLFNRPLPKVHYSFGPMKLRDALEMLVGEAYTLKVNYETREVCFDRRLDIPKKPIPPVQVEVNASQSQ
ncbi:hypothetical protein [Pasteurella multocida]|uniref:PFGI-1 class ICE element type IV pilus protein PilL2 n=1 Tax=Pasteurella multocida TaxID=747 RepID=UPI0030CABB42